MKRTAPTPQQYNIFSFAGIQTKADAALEVIKRTKRIVSRFPLHSMIYEPTMMLLMGMWISLTKKPMKPIMQKPIAVAIAIFWNSLRSGLVQRFTKRMESLAKTRPGSQNLTTLSMAREELKRF